MKYTIGIDLGTSALKATLADEKGHLLSSERVSYRSYSPKQNWSEQQPGDWEGAMNLALKKLTKKADGPINALSFSGQMHGLVLLDKQDRVIRPAILWNDSRVTEEVDYLNHVVGEKVLLEETGNIALCGFTAPKILWVKKHEEDIFQKIAKIMLPKDYLAYRLTGVHASDVSDLSGTLLFDVEHRCYSKKMLEICSIREEQLPAIHESSDVVGFVTHEMSLITGLPETCKVVIGGGDQAVGAVGTATLKEGDLFLSLGTSGVVFAPRDHFSKDEMGRIHSFRHANGKFLLMGCTLSCTASLNWWVNILGSDLGTVIEKVGENSPIDPHLLFLPYLVGERSPINDPSATGIFYGLNASHTQENLTRSVLEGVAFSLYDVYSYMKELGVKQEAAKLIGGGSNNPLWCQILADVFSLRMDVIQTSDGAALGAIALAMVGNGDYPNVEEATSSLVKVVKSYFPKEENTKIYREKFAKYRELYRKTKGL